MRRTCERRRDRARADDHVARTSLNLVGGHVRAATSIFTVQLYDDAYAFYWHV